MDQTIVYDNMEDFTSFVAKETCKLLIGQAKGNTKDAYKLLAAYHKHFIYQVLVGALSTKADPLDDAEEHYNVVRKNVAGVKFDVQASVANAFKRAFGEFSGKRVDYYCTIKPVPEPTSKLSN